ncbi:MAG: hypothetical protein Ct9H300mP32_0800 [Verrucomicrobiota bacterium]|nr:MAG: hypothetical protein Ct9H300mP32_0800 [Verrucomicrobiota bacterium]
MIGFESCALLSVVNERTMENLCASLARRCIVLPNVIPGIVVGISPVIERMPAGALILGSNVSYCDGPPCWNKNTTHLSLARPPAFLTTCSARSRSGSAKPPSPKLPTERNSRRLQWLALSPSISTNTKNLHPPHPGAIFSQPPDQALGQWALVPACRPH